MNKNPLAGKAAYVGALAALLLQDSPRAEGQPPELFADFVPSPEFKQLHDLFSKPYGRGYPGRYWGGMQLPRTRHGHTMFRMREDDGDHFFAYDDTEYHAPPRKKVKFDDLARRSQRRVMHRYPHVEFKPDTELLVDQPWRRVTPKAERPGAERRARLRMEREAA